jgi:hypothetical protein
MKVAPSRETSDELTDARAGEPSRAGLELVDHAGRLVADQEEIAL